MTAWKLTRRGRRAGYRRRKPLPAIAAFVVLCVAAGVVWITVFDSRGAKADRTHCASPNATSTGQRAASEAQQPDADEPGTVLDGDALDTTAPLPPEQVDVQVLNAGGQRGQAGLVTLALKQLGFGTPEPPGNDPFYPDQNLRCDGQIRFGPEGAAAARTLSLVDPCAELVRDDRKGGNVTFSIGTMFHDVTPSPAARKVLNALASSADGEHATRDDGGGGDAIGQRLLERAAHARCG